MLGYEHVRIIAIFMSSSVNVPILSSRIDISLLNKTTYEIEPKIFLLGTKYVMGSNLNTHLIQSLFLVFVRFSLSIVCNR